jgi:hypothetical protein
VKARIAAGAQTRGIVGSLTVVNQTSTPLFIYINGLNLTNQFPVAADSSATFTVNDASPASELEAMTPSGFLIRQVVVAGNQVNYVWMIQ